MAGIGVPIVVTCTNVGAQNVAWVAECISALGPTASNADNGGTWTTSWASINFSSNKGSKPQRGSLEALVRLVGEKPVGMTVTLVA